MGVRERFPLYNKSQVSPSTVLCFLSVCARVCFCLYVCVCEKPHKTWACLDARSEQSNAAASATAASATAAAFAAAADAAQWLP